MHCPKEIKRYGSKKKKLKENIRLSKTITETTRDAK